MENIPVVLAVLLLTLMGILAGGAVRRESITVDEVAHIGAGVSYLQKFDMRMNLEHPPLAKVFAAVPLAVRGVRADYSHISWSFSNRGFGVILGQWVWGHALALQWNDPYSTVLWARVPMLLLTLLLDIFVYRHTSELGGTWGGLLCLVAYVSTPAFLAFGPLVLTDIPVALFRRLLMPPWLYLRGLFFFALMSSRPTFLLGHSYPHGVWFYFPVMFALKSTLAFLLMLVIAIPVGVAARRKAAYGTIIPADKRYHWCTVWVFLVVFTGFCMLSRMTISIRHFTIPILLMILLLAPIPRAIAQLAQNRTSMIRALTATYVFLSIFSLVTMIRTYPYYFPFLNSFSFGRPAYHLVNDSSLDWNQGLLDVESYVAHRGLTDVLVDEYGFNDPAVYVPQSRVWSCQQPLSSDAGHWAFVSADVIEESHNCIWLLQYPHEALAGGSMYAFKLPETIPAAGTPAGPPAESDLHFIFGVEMPGLADSRLTFLQCIKDPNQLQPTMDKMIALSAEEQAKRKARRGHH